SYLNCLSFCKFSVEIYDFFFLSKRFDGSIGCFFMLIIFHLESSIRRSKTMFFIKEILRYFGRNNLEKIGLIYIFSHLRMYRISLEFSFFRLVLGLPYHGRNIL